MAKTNESIPSNFWDGWSIAGKTTCKGYNGSKVELYLRYKYVESTSEKIGHTVYLYLCAKSSFASLTHNWNEVHSCTLIINDESKKYQGINYDFDNTTVTENIYPWGPYAVDSSGNYRDYEPYSFFVEHSNEKEIIIEGSFTTGSDAIESSGTSATITLPAIYTAPTKPTDFKCNTTVLVPGKSTSLSWTNSSNGTNNKVNKYTVQYKVGTGSWINISTTASLSNGSFSWTVPSTFSDSRGSTVYLRIRANGTNTSYNSSWSDEFSLPINRLPSKPTVSGSIEVSSSGSISISATPGKDEDKQQTYSVYYAEGASANTPTTKYSDSLTDAKTYRFWTYDGFEYSDSYTEATGKRNTKPTIKASYISAPYSANGVTDGYINGLVINYDLNKPTGKVYTEVRIGNETIDSSSSTVSSSKASIALDINNILKSKYVDEEISYSVIANYNDGIEYSGPITVIENAKISASPKITKWSNNGIDFTNNTTNFCFGESLYLQYNNDTEAPLTNVTVTSGIVSIVKRSNGEVQLSVTSATEKKIDFTLQFYNGSFYKTSTITLRQVETPSITYSEMDTDIIYCFDDYTDTELLTFSCTKPFPDNSSGANYGFSSNNALTNSNTYLELLYNSEITKIDLVESPSWNDSDYLRLKAKKSDFKILNEIWPTYRIGSYEARVRMAIVNNQGMIFYSPYEDLILNYNREPDEIVLSIKDKDGNPLTENLQENMIIKFNVSGEFYSQEDYEVLIYVDRSGSSIDDNRQYVQFSTGQIPRSSIGRSVPNNIDLIVSTENIKEITTDKTRVFKCDIIGKTSKTTVSSEKITAEVLRHTAPTNFTIEGIEYNSNNALTKVKLNSNFDPGYNSGSFTLKLNGNINISNDGVLSEPLSPIPASLQLTLTSTVEGFVTNTKTYYSNIFLFFDEAPTVSYRKNLVGINLSEIDGISSDIQSNSSIIIGNEASGKQFITLYCVSNQSNTPIIRTIDMTSGALSNFTIHGGTW